MSPFVAVVPDMSCEFLLLCCRTRIIRFRIRRQPRGCKSVPRTPSLVRKAHHTLCPAHACGERNLRCRSLIPHGCPLIGRRPQGRLRHGFARDGQWGLQASGQTHARLSRRPGESTVPGYRGFSSYNNHHRGGSPCTISPQSPPSDNPRLRSDQHVSPRTLVEQLLSPSDRLNRPPQPPSVRLTVFRGNPG